MCVGKEWYREWNLKARQGKLQLSFPTTLNICLLASSIHSSCSLSWVGGRGGGGGCAGSAGWGAGHARLTPDAAECQPSYPAYLQPVNNSL